MQDSSSVSSHTSDDESSGYDTESVRKSPIL